MHQTPLLSVVVFNRLLLICRVICVLRPKQYKTSTMYEMCGRSPQLDNSSMNFPYSFFGSYWGKRWRMILSFILLQDPEVLLRAYRVFYKCWVKCLIWCFTVYERTGRSSGFMLFLIQFPMWSGTWCLPILFSSLKLYQNVMFVNFFNLLWLNCYGNAKHVLLIQRDRTPSVLKLCLHNWCPCLSDAYNIQP